MDGGTDEVQNSEKDATEATESPPTKFSIFRIVSAFWILGLCNNYIYVIMLSGAYDIISKVESQELALHNKTEAPYVSAEGRNCTKLTAGAILLADIIPTLVVKFVCPFLPFYVHIRILVAVVTGIISLVLVAVSDTVLIAIIGVCFASFNSGLGEITLLAYSTNFVLHAIAGWSSGTGGAGLAGSFAYAGMTEGGATPEMALLISISVPVVMALAFWAILRHPEDYRHVCATYHVKDGEAGEKLTWASMFSQLKDKLCFTYHKLLKFMIPVGLVYYFEYLINSGLFDKFEFHNTSISKGSQFRWYNAMYQIGVFISRSSVTWIHFERIWIMTILQAVNCIVLIFEAIYGFIPNIWIMFLIIFWEGLLGGAAYVNTFYNMSYMIEKEKRLFALSIASVADTLGIVLSGVTAFPLHDFICQLPFHPLYRWP